MDKKGGGVLVGGSNVRAGTRDAFLTVFMAILLLHELAVRVERSGATPFPNDSNRIYGRSHEE